MRELTYLEFGVVLWMVHVLVQAGVGNLELPFGYLFTSRDKPAAAGGLLFGRATRALANYVENFTPFVAVALALIFTQRTGGAGALGATIWILARVVYIPAYLFGHYVCAHAGMGDFDCRPFDDAEAAREWVSWLEGQRIADARARSASIHRRRTKEPVAVQAEENRAYTPGAAQVRAKPCFTR